MSQAIQIVEYDPDWPHSFTRLGASLRGALGALALRIDHIGSTSVVGLAAKPIIDVQISVAALEPVERIAEPLAQAGFVWRADNPDRLKRYFRERSGARRTHIHVRAAGSWSEQFALLFRDYLRAHPEHAAEYARHKYILAQQYGVDREGYTNAKTPFIWATMARADAWAKEVAWQPGPSDA